VTARAFVAAAQASSLASRRPPRRSTPRGATRCWSTRLRRPARFPHWPHIHRGQADNDVDGSRRWPAWTCRCCGWCWRWPSCKAASCSGIGHDRARRGPWKTRQGQKMSPLLTTLRWRQRLCCSSLLRRAFSRNSQLPRNLDPPSHPKHRQQRPALYRTFRPSDQPCSTRWRCPALSHRRLKDQRRASVPAQILAYALSKVESQPSRRRGAKQPDLSARLLCARKGCIHRGRPRHQLPDHRCQPFRTLSFLVAAMHGPVAYVERRPHQLRLRQRRCQPTLPLRWPAPRR